MHPRKFSLGKWLSEPQTGIGEQGLRTLYQRWLSLVYTEFYQNDEFVVVG